MMNSVSMNRGKIRTFTPEYCDFLVGTESLDLDRNFDKYSKSVNLICEDDGEELSVEQGDLQVLLDGLTQEAF